MSTVNLCSITASLPESFWSATTKVSINAHKVNALLDTGSSESFIDVRVTSKLQIKIRRLKKEYSDNNKFPVFSFRVVNLQINNSRHKSVNF